LRAVQWHNIHTECRGPTRRRLPTQILGFVDRTIEKLASLASCLKSITRVNKCSCCWGQNDVHNLRVPWCVKEDISVSAVPKCYGPL
jgi:hypothetical protein